MAEVEIVLSLRSIGASELSRGTAILAVPLGSL
jgi:hypothetical protein